MVRKTWILAVLVLLTTGCATTGSDTREQSNTDMIRGLYDAFGRGDAATVLGALDQAVVWNEAENVGYDDRNPYIGPDAVAEGVFGRILRDFEGFTVTPQEFIAEGDTVVALGRYSGTSNATREKLDAQFVHVWKLRDGKVVSFQQYADTAQFSRLIRVSR